MDKYKENGILLVHDKVLEYRGEVDTMKKKDILETKYVNVEIK